MSDALSWLFKKEQLWANCSRHSLQKSDREQIDIVSLFQKMAWVIWSWFTLSLSKNEWFARKNSYISYVLAVFHCFSLLMPKRESLSSLFALSLFYQEQIALLLFCSQKTSDSPKKNQWASSQPMSKFPTLDIYNEKNVSPYFLFSGQIFTLQEPPILSKIV